MSDFVGKSVQKQTIKFEDLLDYPGLSIDVEWTITAADMQKPKGQNFVESLVQTSKY